MDPKLLFRKSITQAGNCLRHIQPSQLAAETPCTEWDLRALLRHMVYEVLWVPELVAGKTIEEVGDRYEGDILGDDVFAAWQEAAKKAQQAVDAAELEGGVAHLSYGDVAASQYVGEVAGDILIHTWDAATAIRCTLFLDPEVAAAVYTLSLPREAEMAASGLYGKRVEVSPDTDVQTKLLALFGRRVA